jgi:hypothetical protein
LRSLRDPETAVFRRRVFWGLQLAMMVDLPGVGRRAGELLTLPPMFEPVLRHFDRGLMLGLFACLAALAIEREGRRDEKDS